MKNYYQDILAAALVQDEKQLKALLLKSSINERITGSTFETAAFTCARNANLAAAEFLITHGARPSDIPRGLAFGGHFEMLKSYLIEHKNWWNINVSVCALAQGGHFKTLNSFLAEHGGLMHPISLAKGLAMGRHLTHLGYFYREYQQYLNVIYIVGGLAECGGLEKCNVFISNLQGNVQNYMDVISEGLALGGHFSDLDRLLAEGNPQVSLNRIARGLAHGGHFVKLDAFFNEHKAELNFNSILSGLAVGGHLEKLEALLSEHKDKLNLNYIIFGLAYCEDFTKLDEYVFKYADEINLCEIAGMLVKSDLMGNFVNTFINRYKDKIPVSAWRELPIEDFDDLLPLLVKHGILTVIPQSLVNPQNLSNDLSKLLQENPHVSLNRYPALVEFLKLQPSAPLGAIDVASAVQDATVSSSFTDNSSSDSSSSSSFSSSTFSPSASSAFSPCITDPHKRTLHMVEQEISAGVVNKATTDYEVARRTHSPIHTRSQSQKAARLTPDETAADAAGRAAEKVQKRS